MATKSGDKLSRYKEKRDFSRTPEPSGSAKASGKKPGEKHLFMVQKHAARRLHYDFRLELDGVLKSWAITRGPSCDPEDKRLAVRTEDHPLEYAAFEGAIPRGEYGGGTVMLWDRGSWAPLHDPQEGLAQGKLHFVLEGERMKGEWVLVRLKPRAGERAENWLLRKVEDQFSGSSDSLVRDFVTSVASGRTMDAIAAAPGATWDSKEKREDRPQAPAPPADAAPRPKRSGARKQLPLPGFAPVQLATLVDRPPDGADWLHEAKYDGYRVLTAVSGDQLKAWTRKGNLFDPPGMAPIAAALRALDARSALLDGEIVVLDEEGRPRFSRLQNAIKEASEPFAYFIFDVLEIDGQSLSEKPLSARKERLRQILAPVPNPVHFAEHIAGQGEKVFEALCRSGYEGVVSKLASSRYLGKRTSSWLKTKCINRQEFVVGGWTRSERRRGFASLLLGLHEGGGLRYVGRVGTGFDAKTHAALTERLGTLVTDSNPFEDMPREARRGAVWVRPELVAEVAFAEFTPDRIIRHASFIGLREDKSADEVVEERPADPRDVAAGMAGEGAASAPPSRPSARRASSGPATHHGIVISNPDRVVFPEVGVTKGQLVDYYEAVGKLMLPQIERRFISLVRCPQGRAKQCFFQKHDSGSFPAGVERLEITESKGKREPYLYVETIQGVIACLQMGTLEFHGWGSRLPDYECADRLVFDLDPDEGLSFSDVRSAALDIRDRLEAIGLTTWPMLTGGKGLHLVAPVRPERRWPAVKEFCRSFAQACAADEPARYTAVLSKASRKGKIFIDYLRNQRGATAIMPYSTRARSNAPVAAPIDWAELSRFDSGAAFTIADVDELVKRARSAWGKRWGISDQSLP
jgi:bifunctional non-homologous end joining protein LigD